MLSSNIVNSNLNIQNPNQSSQSVQSSQKSKKMLNDKPLFVYNEQVEIEKDMIGFFLGKGKKNLESLQTMSRNVILDFKKVNRNYSLITIKSNHKEEYNLVKKQLYNQLRLASDKLRQVKETRKGIRKLKEKQRENKMRKELEEKIKIELESKNNLTYLQSTDMNRDVDTTRPSSRPSTITHLEINTDVLNGNYNANKTQGKDEEGNYIKPKNIFTLLEVE